MRVWGSWVVFRVFIDVPRSGGSVAEQASSAFLRLNNMEEKKSVKKTNLKNLNLLSEARIPEV